LVLAENCGTIIKIQLQLHEESSEFLGVLAVKLVRLPDFAGGRRGVSRLLEGLRKESDGVGEVGYVLVVDSPRVLIVVSTFVLDSVIVVAKIVIAMILGVQGFLWWFVFLLDGGFRSLWCSATAMNTIS
jgi:hypothetical protein